ncbi:MAG: hypothetical protein ACLPZR_23770 [Solirubrobacteraceae bacterium]
MATVTVVGCVQVDLVITPVVELPPSGGTLPLNDMGIRLGGAGANAALAFVELGVQPRSPRPAGCSRRPPDGGW